MRTTFLPARPKHEVIDDQLTLVPKQLSQRLLAIRTVKDVFLVHLDPGQAPPLLVQLIEQSREFLFFHEQRLASRHPRCFGHDFVFFRTVSRFQFGHDVLLCFTLMCLRCRKWETVGLRYLSPKTAPARPSTAPV